MCVAALASPTAPHDLGKATSTTATLMTSLSYPYLVAVARRRITPAVADVQSDEPCAVCDEPRFGRKEHRALREGGCSPVGPGVFTRQPAPHRARSRKLAGASRNELGASRRRRYCAYGARAVGRPRRLHTRLRRSSARVLDEGPRHAVDVKRLVRAETSASSQTPSVLPLALIEGPPRGARISRLRAAVSRLARRTLEASQR